MREELRLHGDGDPEVTGLSGIDAAEMRRRDPDNGERDMFDRDFFSQHRRIKRKEPIPHGVANDGYGMSARTVVLIRREGPADHGVDAQQGKEIDGDYLCFGGFSTTSGG